MYQYKLAFIVYCKLDADSSKINFKLYLNLYIVNITKANIVTFIRFKMQKHVESFMKR